MQCLLWQFVQVHRIRCVMGYGTMSKPPPLASINFTGVNFFMTLETLGTPVMAAMLHLICGCYSCCLANTHFRQQTDRQTDRWTLPLRKAVTFAVVA